MFQYLDYMTTVNKRFKTVNVTSPVRGHSYTEPDKDMGLIPLNKGSETPDDLRDVIM
jgi:hypothetical protein